MLVSQPNFRPTNKLTASVIAGALVAVAHTGCVHFWPWTDDSQTWLAIGPVVAYLVGNYVKDEDNSPMTTDDNNGGAR